MMLREMTAPLGICRTPLGKNLSPQTLGNRGLLNEDRQAGKERA